MLKKIKNYRNNLKIYGFFGVIVFYSKNILFGEQTEFNTRKLLDVLIRDFLFPIKYFIEKIYIELKPALVRLHIFPMISVIMSVHNGEEYLKESLESILRQTFTNFEFLIIDDSSTDKTSQILQRYQNKDKRVRIFTNQENLGLTKSLNILLKKTRGKYIARMDADDISLPDRLLKQYLFLEEHKDIFLVGTGAYNIDEKGSVLSISEPLTTWREVEKRLPIENCIYHPSIMFRNKGYMYRDKFVYAQDYDFYLNVLTRGEKLTNLSDHLIKYRIVKTSISIQNKKAQDFFAEQARLFYRQRKECNNYKDEYCNFNSNL